MSPRLTPLPVLPHLPLHIFSFNYFMKLQHFPKLYEKNQRTSSNHPPRIFLWTIGELFLVQINSRLKQLASYLQIAEPNYKQVAALITYVRRISFMHVSLYFYPLFSCETYLKSWQLVVYYDTSICGCTENVSIMIALSVMINKRWIPLELCLYANIDVN